MLLGLSLAGCQKGEAPAQAPSAGHTTNPNAAAPAEAAKAYVVDKPVTLTVAPIVISITDEDFQTLLVEPVKKVHPNITLQLIKPGKGTNIEDLLAAGTPPDILLTWNGRLLFTKEMGLLEDVSPLLKSHNIELSRFEPAAIDAIRMVSDEKELYALPFALQHYALYYNKGIFDKFGVPYPKDGMTWDDTVELAKKVTRSVEGTSYRGMGIQNLASLHYPLSLGAVDAKTNKATVHNEQWKKVFELGKSIYGISGNAPSKYFNNDDDVFVKNKNIAMLTAVNMIPRLLEAEKEKSDLNWDTAQYPSFAERPNTYAMMNTHVAAVTKSSKNKDAAAEVLKVLTSDEVQLISSRRTARLTSLRNPEIVKQFGAEIPSLKGKHADSIFKSKHAPAVVMSEYLGKATTILRDEFTLYIGGGKDVNSALREAEEKINKLTETDQK
jgi:multiple sugar transport system substrate-binding protein